MKKQDVDYITLKILNTLYNDKEVRYKDFQIKLKISYTPLVKRLDKLKHAKYVEPKAKTNENGHSFIVYVLTKLGIKLVKELDIGKFLDKMEYQFTD